MKISTHRRIAAAIKIACWGVLAYMCARLLLQLFDKLSPFFKGCLLLFLSVVLVALAVIIVWCAYAEDFVNSCDDPGDDADNHTPKP